MIDHPQLAHLFVKWVQFGPQFENLSYRAFGTIPRYSPRKLASFKSCTENLYLFYLSVLFLQQYTGVKEWTNWKTSQESRLCRQIKSGLPKALIEKRTGDKLDSILFNTTQSLSSMLLQIIHSFKQRILTEFFKCSLVQAADHIHNKTLQSTKQPSFL